MSRLRPVLVPASTLVLAAVISGCYPAEPGAATWRDHATQTLEQVQSEVATVGLLLQAGEDGKAFGPYQQTVAVDSETAVGTTTSTFTGQQPPADEDESFDEVSQVLSDASDLLTDVRIAVVRRETASYAGLRQQLTDLGADLDEVALDLEGRR